MFSWSMSVDLVVYSNMDACLYCVGNSFLACCGFGGCIVFACVCFVWPNCRMSFDWGFDFRFLVLVRDRLIVGAFGINCRISDALCLSWSFASWIAVLMNWVLLVNQCFIAVVLFSSQSSISVWNGKRSWTRSLGSCWYRARILVNKASLVASLDVCPVAVPCSFSFLAFHRNLWYLHVSRII